MPAAEEILAALTAIANDWMVVAIAILGSAWLAATAFTQVSAPVAGQRHSALAAR